MNLRTAIAVGLIAGILQWVTGSWAVPIPWVVLAVVYATVLGGASAGVGAAVSAGILVGATSGSVGPWILALTLTVPPVDWLHRETLTHRTPAASVLLTAVGIAVAYAVFWTATTALHLLVPTFPTGSTVPSSTRALVRTLATGLVAVIAARSIRTLGLRISRAH